MALIDDALCMAAHGIRVHPLRARGKVPVLRKWQSVRLTVEDVRHTFRADSNVGIVLGEQMDGSKLVVIDCDGEKWMEWTLARFPEPVLVTRNSDTGGGHVWYRWTGRLPKKQMLGVDRTEKHSNAQLLSTGAQVVAPPSIHPEGRQYKWYVDGVEATTQEAMSALKRLPTINAPTLRDICPAPAPPPKTSTLVALNVDLRTVDLLAAFRMSGMLRREVDPGKYAVVCPWDGGHTDPDPDASSANTSTVIGDKPGGGYWFKCLHASCDGKSYVDVLATFGIDIVAQVATRSARAGKVNMRAEMARKKAARWRDMGV